MFLEAAVSRMTFTVFLRKLPKRPERANNQPPLQLKAARLVAITAISGFLYVTIFLLIWTGDKNLML